jgi:hypothetical protein
MARVPDVLAEDSMVRKRIAQKPAGRCIPIAGLATAEDDDGDTRSLSIALELQVYAIEEGQKSEGERQKSIAINNLHQDEREV